MIALSAENIRDIISHAESDYPNECGGLLLGRFEGDERAVLKTLRMKNIAAEETQHDRVLIDPRELLKTDRPARNEGLDVIGYYHSHPDDEAVPSQFDLDHALPVWSYIIVSVRDGKAADQRSWRMRDDRSKFDHEGISVTGEI